PDQKPRATCTSRRCPLHASRLFLRPLSVSQKPCFSASEVLEHFTSKIASVAKLKSSPRHVECNAHDPSGLGVEITAGEKKGVGGQGPAPAMKVLMQILRVKRMTGFGAASVRKCVSARRMTIF